MRHSFINVHGIEVLSAIPVGDELTACIKPGQIISFYDDQRCDIVDGFARSSGFFEDGRWGVKVARIAEDKVGFVIPASFVVDEDSIQRDQELLQLFKEMRYAERTLFGGDLRIDEARSVLNERALIRSSFSN